MDIKKLSQELHTIAKEKGFWEPKKCPHCGGELPEKRNFGEMIALIHSELSEALEADRQGNPPCEKIPEITAIEEEMADALIRILDICEGNNFDIIKAIEMKMDFNSKRAWKHGKKY